MQNSEELIERNRRKVIFYDINSKNCVINEWYELESSKTRKQINKLIPSEKDLVE